MRAKEIELDAAYVIRDGDKEVRGTIYGTAGPGVLVVRLWDRGGLHDVLTRNILRRWVENRDLGRTA